MFSRPMALRFRAGLPHSLRPILTERTPLLDVSEQEIQTAISHFQSALSDDSIPNVIYARGKPDADEIARGKELYSCYGCRACHPANPPGGYRGPPLDDVRGCLFSDNSPKIKPAVIERNYNLDDSGARALTTYVVSLPAPKERR